MSAASIHPRRRPARANSPCETVSLVDSFQNMSIRKGETFHNPTSTEKKTELWDPLENSKNTPSMPGRSTTCPKSLEDLLIGAGERRTVELLARVDKAIETQSKLALGAALNEPEVLPVPSFIVEQAGRPDGTPRSRPRPHRNSHSSDSGMGSSVADSTDTADAKPFSTGCASPSSSTHSLSGISAATEQRGLSKYASQQIHKYIVEPILDEAALKDFHPLIEGVPERIGNKEIKTLRDLEKTLIFLAPDHSRSPSKYLRFCERTIRVLHTTVTTLHESDQRAPADRPYTQGYFFDLVEQIRRYAMILAATRKKQAEGENLDTMDFTEGESVSIHGGMSHTGKPAELVRHTKDGKTISLATGLELSPDDVASASMKRPMHDVDNDDVARSMARRKKGAKPEIHECPLCDKEFKRPCDLTKHVKTHERPWKCPEADCKYHAHGWPTEKERDRHVNDKHSAAPPLYQCLYDGCPYTSKRESNCKQHMEKAHGWAYVRSKNNGKGKADTVHLPHGSMSASPSSAMLTPLTPIAPSPSMQSLSSSAASRHHSLAPMPGLAGPSNYGTPAFTNPSSDFVDHFSMDFDFNNMNSAWPTPAMSDDRHTSGSSTSGLQLDGSVFDDMSPQELHYDPNFDFSTFSFQQPSPPSTSGAQHHLSIDSGCSSGGNILQASPGAQLDQTVSGNYYDTNMKFDEGFGDPTVGPSQDFTLFGNTAGVANVNYNGEMMPSLPNESSSWGTFGNNVQLPTDNSALQELFPDLMKQ